MSSSMGTGWWQASDGNWYPPQASEGWWQASDGNWYPPQASEGWWQASDGNWYPPDPQRSTPTPTVTPPPLDLTPGGGRQPLTPQGPAPTADDVAPAGSEEGELLLTRHRALDRLDWATSARSPLDRFAEVHGSDEAAAVALADAPSDPPATLHWALEELRTGEETLRSLTTRRDDASAALATAERSARSAKTKALIAGVVVLVLLVLVLFVL